MRCEEVQEILEKGNPSRDATTHVAGCGACRDFSRDLDISLRAFAAIPSETLSLERSQSLRVQVRTIAKTRSMQVMRRPWWADLLDFLGRPGPVLALAGACAIFLLVLMKRPGQVAVVPPQPHHAAGSAAVVPPSHPTGPSLQVAVLSGEVWVGDRHVESSAGGSIGSHGSTIGVAPDDTIRTGADKPAIIAAGGQIQVALAALSSIRVADRRLTLASGQVAIHVRKGSGEGYTADSARLSVRVLGTRFELTATRVDALEGSLAVTPAGGVAGSIRIQGGQGARVTGDGSLESEPLAAARMGTLVGEFSRMEGGITGIARDIGLGVHELTQRYLTPRSALPTVPPSLSPPSPPPTASAPVPGAVAGSVAAPAIAASPTAPASSVVNPLEGLGSQRK